MGSHPNSSAQITPSSSIKKVSNILAVLNQSLVELEQWKGAAGDSETLDVVGDELWEQPNDFLKVVDVKVVDIGLGIGTSTEPTKLHRLFVDGVFERGTAPFEEVTTKTKSHGFVLWREEVVSEED
jgi:hypothetical protein